MLSNEETMSIEEKLASYRSRKKREKKIESTKKILRDIVTLNFWKRGNESTLGSGSPEDENLIPLKEPAGDDPTVVIKGKRAQVEVEEQARELDKKCGDERKESRKLEKSLLYGLWIVLLILSLISGFGIVYLTVSLLIYICLNTRTGGKAPGEVSAYSVFNPNCEAIAGTLKAEQFERELGYGGHSVK